MLRSVVFSASTAKPPFDRCATASCLMVAHSASRKGLSPAPLRTSQRASTDVPPQSLVDALRQTAIRCRATQPRSFKDSGSEIAAFSATFTDTHPKHSSIRFEKAAFMTIRSNTHMAARSETNAIQLNHSSGAETGKAGTCTSSLQAETSSMSGSLPKREIAFIDRGVDDLETLLAGIRPTLSQSYSPMMN